MGHFPLAAIAGQWSALVTVYLPALLIFPALITWGEEPGWRGFALTRLQAEFHPVVASLVVGALHGLWHLPTFLLVSGPPAGGPFNLHHFLFNTATIMVITVLWTWVFNRAAGSILIAVLLHASGNATGALMGRWFGDLPADLGGTMFWLYLGLAVVAIAATRGRLGYRPEKAPAAAPD